MSWITKAYIEATDLYTENLAYSLDNAIRPAKSTASEIRTAYNKKFRELLKEGERNKMLVALYESFFPNLPQLCDMSPDETPVALDDSFEIKTEYDSMRKWLTRAEYDLLSSSERNQLALDNYKHRKRSNWEAGRDYERYVGYLNEMDGYSVDYFGALKGFEDLGRDLYVIKDSKMLIIQCKRWASDKVIHEKHIFQLFGTVTMYRLEHPLDMVQGMLFYTCELSDTAKEVAALLDIECRQLEYRIDYPMIKCNIGATGEKIYHLPFDQQYDRVKIDPAKGEFYAYTVKEAERNGFRRAKHWKSDDKTKGE